MHIQSPTDAPTAGPIRRDVSDTDRQFLIDVIRHAYHARGASAAAEEALAYEASRMMILARARLREAERAHPKEAAEIVAEQKQAEADAAKKKAQQTAAA